MYRITVKVGDNASVVFEGDNGEDVYAMYAADLERQREALQAVKVDIGLGMYHDTVEEGRIPRERREPTVWECKIGSKFGRPIPGGLDGPFRRAVEEAFRETFGAEPEFCFSGWTGTLSADEMKVAYPKR